LDKYKIFETSEYLNKLEKITSREKSFIERKLIKYVYPQLREEHHFGNNIKKLVNYKPETWRYRIGKHRLFYVIEESVKTIYLLSIDLRKEAY